MRTSDLIELLDDMRDSDDRPNLADYRTLRAELARRLPDDISDEDFEVLFNDHLQGLSDTIEISFPGRIETAIQAQADYANFLYRNPDFSDEQEAAYFEASHKRYSPKKS